MKNQPKTGAFPPEIAGWQIGKSAVSIRFVRDASIALETENLESLDRGILQEGIRMVKEGEVAFSNWMTPQEWISQVKNVKK